MKHKMRHITIFVTLILFLFLLGFSYVLWTLVENRYSSAWRLEEILKNKGHTTMLTDGKRLVREGITTQEELYKVCGIPM